MNRLAKLDRPWCLLQMTSLFCLAIHSGFLMSKKKIEARKLAAVDQNLEEEMNTEDLAAF